MGIEECKWPEGNCKCWEEKQKNKEDHSGRVWMHCEEGLSLTKASMSRFMMYCLSNGVQIGDVYAFNPSYKRSLVVASVRLKPEQIEEFETETGGKLKEPPTINLN